MIECYRFADKNFMIDSLYHMIHKMCDNYRISECDGYIIHIDEEDIEIERQKSALEDNKEGIPIRHFSDEYLETLAVYRKIVEYLIDYNTILVHGSVIAVDGEGYLFTAKSGTGKSTHTRLWREQFGERAVIVNDDKPLLQIGANIVKVYGTPWDGKHKLSSNISVPLKTICILKRDEVNHINRLTGNETYPLLLQHTYRSSNTMKMIKTLELLEKVIQTTKIYSLGCNMESEAALIAYEGMQ